MVLWHRKVAVSYQGTQCDFSSFFTFTGLANQHISNPNAIKMENQISERVAVCLVVYKWQAEYEKWDSHVHRWIVRHDGQRSD